MTIVGSVESLWRYPVKSMAGEAIEEAFVGYAGVFGDRACAVLNAAAPEGFPYLTARNNGADAALSSALSRCGACRAPAQSGGGRGAWGRD